MKKPELILEEYGEILINGIFNKIEEDILHNMDKENSGNGIRYTGLFRYFGRERSRALELNKKR